MNDQQDQRDSLEDGDGGEVVGVALIRYSAYVIITLAILYFLANYVLNRF